MLTVLSIYQLAGRKNVQRKPTREELPPAVCHTVMTTSEVRKDRLVAGHEEKVVFFEVRLTET